MTVLDLGERWPSWLVPATEKRLNVKRKAHAHRLRQPAPNHFHF
jgi:hypothetical protein